MLPFPANNLNHKGSKYQKKMYNNKLRSTAEILAKKYIE